MIACVVVVTMKTSTIEESLGNSSPLPLPLSSDSVVFILGSLVGSSSVVASGVVSVLFILDVLSISVVFSGEGMGELVFVPEGEGIVDVIESFRHSMALTRRKFSKRLAIFNLGIVMLF